MNGMGDLYGMCLHHQTMDMRMGMMQALMAMMMQ